MEAHECHNKVTQAAVTFDAEQTKTRDASAKFFVLELEASLIRPLAVALGYVPANVDILRLSCEDVEMMRSEQGAEYEFLDTAKTHDGFIKGTNRKSFPQDGPSSKYAALFDARLDFDNFRHSFLVFADARREIHTFLSRLQDLIPMSDPSQI